MFKKIIILFAVILTASLLHAQEFKFPKNVGSVSVGIPGTQIMIDQNEVSMSDWFAFVYNTYYNIDEYSFSDGYEQVMLDSNLFPEKYRFMIRIFSRFKGIEDGVAPQGYELYQYSGYNSNKKFYLLLSKSEGKLEELLERFLNLPVVCISYEQAQMYLQWRDYIANDNKQINTAGYNVKARMMTKVEWQKLARDLGPHFTENKTAQIDSVNKEGCYLLNVTVDKPCPSVLEGIRIYGTGAVTVAAYNPDRLGLYSIFGNVSEMTQEKGIALGGSYKDYASICNASITIPYTKPEQWLGFRCVLEFSK